MTTNARLTADDLWRLGEGDVRRELVDGQIIEMPPVGPLHGAVTGKICHQLIEHANRTGAGAVVVGDVGFVLQVSGDPERVRAPDVAFLRRDRLTGGLPERFWRGAPDLAVEVLSPSDDPVDVQQKVRDYLDAGTQLVWVVAPKPRTVTVYRADGSARLVREPEAVEGEDVLPGLGIPLADLFT